MKDWITKNKLFILIVLLASALRFYQLGVVPPSPDWDEVALGYNAYSVLKTGRDEYGTWFPLSLRSFDDYKPPLYMYLSIPSIAVFGLTTWAVRLPSAVFGVLAVVGVYVLVSELVRGEDKKKQYIKRWLPLMTMFLFALSPWHIQFSRIAFEANIGVTLNIWAVLFFLKGLKNGRALSVSALLFGLALVAYHSERIFAPLLVLLLAFIYRKELFAIKKHAVIAGFVGLLVVLPMIPVFFNQNTLTRLRGTSSLADQTGLLARSVTRLERDQALGVKLGTFLDNRRVVWAKTLVNGYLSHYSLRWWFLTGDNPRHHAPDMGLLYFWEFPFLILGMLSLYMLEKRTAALFIGWFFLAPVAASPTTELPHAIRTLVFLPTFQVFTALGIVQFVLWLKTHKGLYVALFACVTVVLFAFNIFYYLHMYFGHMNREYSKSWQYGYREAVAYVEKVKGKYKKIVVSTKLEQPHMFFLFFMRYDPAAYLAEGGTASGGFAEYRNKFDIYEFRKINWDTEQKDGSVLYVGPPTEIPYAGGATIYYLDGSEAIRITDR